LVRSQTLYPAELNARPMLWCFVMSLTTKPSIYHDIENVNTKNEKN
jgi:hypothetical protein